MLQILNSIRVVDSRNEFLVEVSKDIEKNPACIELGVHTGDFALAILVHLNPKKLVLVDPWVNGSDKHGQTGDYPSMNLSTAYSTESEFIWVNNRFSHKISDGTVVLNRNFSYDAINDFEDNSFDFIYIDACHLYDSVLWDLENYITKLKPNGLICGHDYIEHGDFGVIQAVDDFCNKYNYRIHIFSPSTGDWAISPISSNTK